MLETEIATFTNVTDDTG